MIKIALVMPRNEEEKRVTTLDAAKNRSGYIIYSEEDDKFFVDPVSYNGIIYKERKIKRLPFLRTEREYLVTCPNCGEFYSPAWKIAKATSASDKVKVAPDVRGCKCPKCMMNELSNIRKAKRSVKEAVGEELEEIVLSRFRDNRLYGLELPQVYAAVRGPRQDFDFNEDPLFVKLVTECDRFQEKHGGLLSPWDVNTDFGTFVPECWWLLAQEQSCGAIEFKELKALQNCGSAACRCNLNIWLPPKKPTFGNFIKL